MTKLGVRSTQRKIFWPAVICGVAAAVAPSPASALSSPICGGFRCSGNGGKPVAGGSNGAHQNPEIVISFWGSAWQGGAQSPSWSQLVGSSLSLVNGPYFSQLNEYAGGGEIGLPRLAPYAPIYTASPPGSPANTSPASFKNSDLPNVINDEISRGMLPPPQSGNDTVYVVYLPNNSSSGNNNNGFNGSSSYNGTGYRWAWVSGDGTLGGNGHTRVFSHEVVEAITAYQGIGISNCTDLPGNGASTNQVSDYCQCGASYEKQNGYTVQGYYSQQYGACVTPESWGSLYQNKDDGAGWTNVFPTNVRQVYGGAAGIAGETVGGAMVATDTNDNVFYNLPGQWVEIGGPGSMFAIGSSVVAGLTPDATSVNLFSAFSFFGGWDGLGTPNGQPVTSVSVTSDDTVIATDPFGQPWFFDPSRGQWVVFGGPGDQFIAMAHNVVAITPDHQAIFEIATNDLFDSGAWHNIGGAAAGLYANACSDAFGGISLDSTQNFLFNSNGGQGWFTQGGPGYSFAVTNIRNDDSGFPALGITHTGGGLWVASSPGFGNWSPLPGQGGRAIGGCNINVTGCPNGQCVFF